jgi:long-chain acyl-CoA synthetase
MTTNPLATQRPWLQSYPPGIPADLDLSAPDTIVSDFLHSTKTYAALDAFESFGKSITFGQLEREAKAFAAFLQSKGYGKGDRVALMMPNVMAYPVALFGTLLAGCTVVNVNPLYTSRELVHQLTDSGARAIVVLENFAHVVQQSLGEVKLDLVMIARAGDLLGLKGMIVNLVAKHVKKVVPAWSVPGAIAFSAVLKQGTGLTYTKTTITPDDIAFLQYTGGTTGVSKGATLLHRNICANVRQSEAWLGHSYINANEQPVMVTALPLYHIFALTCCCIMMMKTGAKCLLVANPRDIGGFVKLLAGSHFTCMSGVNTLYNALLHHPDIKSVKFDKVTMCVAGGMALQSAVATKWKELSGAPIVEGYGLSETSPVVCVNRYDIADFTGTIGYPVPSTDVVLRDETNRDVALGEPGELCVRGPQVMPGYWQRPDETAKVMTADGYFRTGDIAIMNADGSFKIVDRAKDMILVSGFNVYPNEVEEVLARHPGVLEVAVIGVPDENSGEAVQAHVVRKDMNLDPEDLRSFCRDSLTGYKVPKSILFRDSLPKTNVGKVLRRALREERSNAA